MLETINEHIKEAMKNKEASRLQALRFFKSKLIENATAKKKLPEQDILISHVKKLRDSLALYPEGDARLGIEEEIKYLTPYLPQALAEAEVCSLIEKIISSLENPNLGMVLKSLMPQIKGRFDGKRAQELVKKSLS